MPIRFRCEYCKSRLSVTTRKAGARAKCPKCGQTITIPDRPRTDSVSVEPSEPSPPPAPDSTTASTEPPSSDSEPPPPASSAAEEQPVDPFAQFLVYDEEIELVYEDEEDEPPASVAALPFDASKVTFSRSLLYAQGILLGVVALFGFVLGVLVGIGGRGGDVAVEEPVPCSITGRIVLRTQDDDTIPDHGAVAIVFPQDARPEAKLEILGLRPQDAEPPADHPALLAIRGMGGDYARADDEGSFRLQVPDRGQYFVMVISATRRNSDRELAKTTLAQVGRFFQLAPDLFSGYDYRWQQETVKGDRQLNFVF
jgi:hypothetical protein